MPAECRSMKLSGAYPSRAHQLIPGGAHTYAKGDDQFPENAPGCLVRGLGSHVWDADGNQYIEYGMGLRAVTLGHAFEPVVQAVEAQLRRGSNFSRPCPIEAECAEELLSLIPGAEMAKFCKDGSMAVDGALKLARAHTGRDMVAICGDHPFFSTNDWFIGTTEMSGGIPSSDRRHVLKFHYNDIKSLEELFDRYPSQIACVLLEPARVEEPRSGFLQHVLDCAHRHGALLVLDEMVTGFRWHLNGAQALYGVTPDLSTFGKALGNGFSVSALVGKRDFMQLGGLDHQRERVFLLSTTHGAETHGLAAAIATMKYYRSHPVVETLHARGARLRQGLEPVITRLGLQENFQILGRDCSLLFATRDRTGKPSQLFRTLFLQELVERGVIAPSFIVSYSHAEEDIDRTIEAATAALEVYRLALDEGIDRYLRGASVKPVFRPYA